MTDLRKAAEAVLERWDSPAWEWKKQGPTADLMANLRTALAAEQPKPNSNFDNQGAVLLLRSKSAEIERLKADSEALRRDAERFRWLRGEHSRIDPCIKANAKYRLERDSSTWVNIHDLDAAIDAAMKEDKT